MKIDIPGLVHEYVTRERESESGKMWPSSLGGCVRREIYRLRGTEETHSIPEPTQWKLHRYGWYEQPIVQALKHGSVGTVLTQVSVSNKHWSGKIDIVIPSVHGWWEIVEVKSISPYGINRPGLPYKHHKLQAWAYAVLAAHDRETTGDGVRIVYISRWDDDDVPVLRQFDVTPTEAELAEVKGCMQVFETYMDAEELAPRPYLNPSEHQWNCMSNFWNNKTKSKPYIVQCPYFGHCWEGYVDPDRGYVEEGGWHDGFIPF